MTPIIPIGLGAAALVAYLAFRKSPAAAPSQANTPEALGIKFLVARDGTKFSPASPPQNIGPTPEIAAQIYTGDMVTFDLSAANLTVNGIASGNIAAKVVRAPGTGPTLDVVPIDPRLPPNMAPVTIPVSSVSGIQPGDDASVSGVDPVFGRYLSRKNRRF